MTHISSVTIRNIAVMVLTVCITAQGQRNFQVQIEQKLSVDAAPSISTNDVPVKAGEMFSFTVKIDPAPNFNGGNLIFVISGPSGGGPSYGVQSSIGLVPGQREYNARILIPADAKAGTWTVTISGISTGAEMHAFSGIKPRTFEVLAKPDLILPTRGEILVNPSQQQVLRMAARRVEAQIQNLKAAVVAYEESKQHGQIPVVLRENVDVAINGLKKTESEFKGKQTNPDQAAMADVFFADLRLNYARVLEELNLSQRGEVRSARVVDAQYPEPSVGDYSVLAQATLRAFDVNELAYNVVADSGSLVFDLKVISDPAGAVVSYYRRGDLPKRCPDPTTATIPSLIYAIWYVLVEKAGYKSETREYDPYHSSDHVVEIRLTR